MEFERVLQLFTEFFDREKVRYAIVGGLAVAAWGRKRSTKDADFAVDLSNQDRVVGFAESQGYETLRVSSGYSNLVHADAGLGRVDFLYLSGPTADRVFAAATVKELRVGHEGRIASPEHLAMMKALAMKNFPHRALYEGEDVRVLLEVPGVDREAVRDYFEQQGLLGLFDAIDKARRAT